MNTPWTLNDARSMIAGMVVDTQKFGYHIALGGSVLTKGISTKDIDLYFLPLSNADFYRPANPKGLISWLESLWGTASAVGEPEPLMEDDPDDDDEGPRIRAMGLIIPQGRPARPINGPEEDGGRLVAPAAGRAVRRDMDKLANGVDEDRATPPYSYRLRFIRGADGDRIDVNIL